MNQTDFSTTTGKILSSFNDNNVKQDEKSKGSISEKNAEFDAKFENQLQTLSLQIQEDNKNTSSRLYYQDKKISYFTTSYYERLDKISTRNKVSTNIETSKTELEETMNKKLDELKLKPKLITQKHSTPSK